jgi:DNA polymerase IV (DinB-like DNA polymerase)
MEIIKKYSPKWEIVSLDEAYLDISFLKSFKKAKKLAQKLKKEIFEKEKLTCTIGIGPNKLMAKIACQIAKPNGVLVVKPAQVKKFLAPLDIEELPGIGPKTGEKLRKLGINKIKELRKLPKTKLKKMFGKVGERIYEKARGIDKEQVSSEKIIKSIGRQYTFERDTRNPEIIFATFKKIIKEVWQELVKNDFSFKTVTVICRFSGFETHTKSKTLKRPTKSLEILEKEAQKLLLKFIAENPKLIRLIGLRIKIC